jgi:hypothetical protein
VGKGWDER